VGDPVREDTRLPGARPGNDQHWALGSQNGLPLGGIEVC
jgi:hypothetical protein